MNSFVGSDLQLDSFVDSICSFSRLSQHFLALSSNPTSCTHSPYVGEPISGSIAPRFSDSPTRRNSWTHFEDAEWVSNIFEVFST